MVMVTILETLNTECFVDFKIAAFALDDNENNITKLTFWDDSVMMAIIKEK